MKTPNKIPSKEELLLNFYYNSNSGKLYRIMASGTKKETGCNSNGYLVIGYKYKMYYAHRIIWKIIKGTDPKGQIDHINGDKSDNRIENLREVTQQENRKNTPIRSDNTSGAVGIYWHKQAKKWCAEIYSNVGTKKYLGLYKNLDDAIKARKNAEKEFGFHVNHGRK